jgi:hypothetical protein
MSRISRLIAISLFAVVAAGALTAAPAVARCKNVGPNNGYYLEKDPNSVFCREGRIARIGEWEEVNFPAFHRRAVGGKGEGVPIVETTPENIRGTGGEQTLSGKVAETAIQIASKSVQIKGAIFDGHGQGQIKEEIIYAQPHLVKPELKGCNVTIGTKNIAVLKGHLAWKWNGEKKQLEEEAPATTQAPDIIVTAIEPTEQKPFVEKINLNGTGVLISVSFSGSGCGVLAGTFNVDGSDVGIPNLNLGEWSKTLSIRTIASEKGIFLQHFFGGEKFQGAEIGLDFGSSAANVVGQTEIEAQQQEIAIFED